MVGHCKTYSQIIPFKTCKNVFLDFVNSRLQRIATYYRWYILILLVRPPCPNGIRIVGEWCSTPCTEAKETLDSVPYLVNSATLYFLFRCPSPGVFLSSPRHPSSATVAAASRAPARSINACYHHCILNCAPWALSDPSHRSNRYRVAI